MQTVYSSGGSEGASLMAEVLGILDTESDAAGLKGTEEGTSLKKE
jgi:hypothetical protein